MGENLGGGFGTGAAGSGAEAGSAREILVRGRGLLSGPAPGVTNKFVITEAEAWFLTLEEGETDPPHLSEMLLAVCGGGLDDESFVEELDARLEEGRVLLGYVLKSGNVEVHSLTDAPNPATRARLGEVFGREIKGVGGDSTGGNASPGAGGTR